MQTTLSSRDYAKYTALVLVMSFVVLSATIFSIIQMTDDYKDGHALVAKAVQWQLRTQGTVALSSKHMRTFKNLSGNIFLDTNDVNALVLGSSTMMGVRHEMFPEGWTTYNFSKASQSLNRAIGEAHYFVEKYESIRWVYIGLDYSIGKAFSRKNIETYNPGVTEEKTTLFDAFSDAITLNRLKITLKNIGAKPFQDKQEYLCPGNEGRGKDFGTVLAPGECWGYRYDGSATFKYHAMSRVKWKSQLNEKSLKNFITRLKKSAGEVNPDHLTHLKAINDLLAKRSGGLVLISPPLMPDAEKIILKSAAGKYLQEYHEKLNRWASVHQIKFIDAGKSEDYGCAPDEFYDAHHALDRCYSKVFERFFKNNPDIF